MIISVSRRTDIPAFYAEWFYNRLRAGYVLVRNPMNVHSVSKVALSPEVVDAFVFWTKNPLPLMKYLDEIAEYPYYFQFTLTGYGKDIEPGLPDKSRLCCLHLKNWQQKPADSVLSGGMTLYFSAAGTARNII